MSGEAAGTGDDSPLDALRPLRRTARVLAGCVALFGVLVSLGLHGFSLSIWRQQIDGTPPAEVLVGRPQEVRIDDYAVILPLALAQEVHDPPFPVVNTLVGRGQNMLLPFSLPVAHPLALFKPDTWGFFLGPDAGLAWRWWSRTLGLFAVAWLLLCVITGGDRALAACGALALVVSPFHQFWTLRAAPVTIHACVLVLAALALAFGRRPRSILAGGAAAGYAAVGFALVLYPPFQIPLAVLALLVFGALAFTHRRALALREQLGWRIAGVVLAAAIAAVAGGLFFHAAGDAIERMLQTAYPGGRVSLGGGRLAAELIAANTFLPLLVADYGRLVHVCEAAGFWLLSPALLAASLVGWLGGRGRPDPVAGVLAGLVAAFALHATTLMPSWLARATLFASVPGHRSMIALGLAEVLLTARLVARAPRLEGAAARLGVALAFGGLVATAALALQGAVPTLPRGASLAAGAVNAGLAWVALGPRRRWHALALLAAASALVSLWFNPLVRGGSSSLRDNELARAVLEIDRAEGSDTVWVAFGALGPRNLFDALAVPNLFRAIGVRSVNGVHPVPQLELWAPLDPGGRARGTYNRYAHVNFAADGGARPRLDRLGDDTFTVHVSPASRALQDLGVTHFVVDTAPDRMRAERAGATWLRSAGRFHLLRAPWREAGAAPPASGAAVP